MPVKTTIKKTSNVIEQEIKPLKGGLKSVDDADDVDDEDYESTDGENEEEKEVEEKEVNSDDELEKEEKDEDVQEGEEDDEEEEEEEDEEDEEEEEEGGEVGDGEDDVVDCVYRFTGKKKNKDTLDFRAEDDFFEEEEKKISGFVDNDRRITKNYMTIYERVRLIGERAKQLSLGAKPMITNVETLGPKEIARIELEKKVIPLVVIRTLPNGLKEKWRVTELLIVN